VVRSACGSILMEVRIGRCRFSAHFVDCPQVQSWTRTEDGTPNRGRQTQVASRASGTLVANRLGASGPTGAISPPQLNENRGYSHILPSSRVPRQTELT
jgi:hypothetical protein